jgi:SH3-like domain-containing protein
MAVPRAVWLPAVLLSAAAVCPAAGAARFFRATADRVNLRARPSDASEVVGQVMAGDLLMVADGQATGEWVRVTPPPSVSLWIYGELVREGRVAVDKAQVRGGPGIQFKAVGQLRRGTPVECRGQVGDWMRIAPPEGSALWISRAYIEPLPPERPPEAEAPPSLAEATPSAEAPAAAADAAASVAALPPAGGDTLPPPAPAPAAAVVPAAGEWPAALAGFAPDPRRAQGVPAVFRGTLSRAGRRVAPRPWRYRIVMPGRRDAAAVLCHLAGLEGQLEELVGAPVEARGRAWHLRGEEPPVLTAECLVALTSPD